MSNNHISFISTFSNHLRSRYPCREVPLSQQSIIHRLLCLPPILLQLWCQHVRYSIYINYFVQLTSPPETVQPTATLLKFSLPSSVPPLTVSLPRVEKPALSSLPSLSTVSARTLVLLPSSGVSSHSSPIIFSFLILSLSSLRRMLSRRCRCHPSPPRSQGP